MSKYSSEIGHYSQDHFDTAKLRRLITNAFNDEEFLTFCFDHFRVTYEKFASGMTRWIKIHLLIEDCYRQNNIEQLLTLLSDYRPNSEWSTCLAPNNGKKLHKSSDNGTVKIWVSDINLNQLSVTQREGLELGFKVTLASVLELPVSEISVLSMEAGSIVLTVSLPSYAIEKLRASDTHLLSEALGIQKIDFHENDSQSSQTRSRGGMDYGMIGKIEKSKFYAQEPQRFQFTSFSVSIKGDSGEKHIITFKDGIWTCDCHFFYTRGYCSHTMALERVLKEMLVKLVSA